jgi:uncharacterized coiled-coil protein SlyX
MRISDLETRMDNAATMNVQNARNIAEQRERIDNMVANLNSDTHNNECTIDELRRKHNALTEEMGRVKARMNAVEAIPEKDFRRDYCHDERLTLTEAEIKKLKDNLHLTQLQASGTSCDLQTHLINHPEQVRRTIKDGIKD